MDTIPLSNAPAGSTVAVPGTVQDDGSVLLDGQKAPLVLGPSAEVIAVDIRFSVGDLAQSVTTGHTHVVRWVSEDGKRWSHALNRSPDLSSAGWLKVGTGSLT